jgi:hypothetical protein
MKHLSDARIKSRLLALPTNIRIDRQHLPKIAYYENYGQKSFITLGPGVDLTKDLPQVEPLKLTAASFPKTIMSAGIISG